jgi:hypothetical protein
MRPTPRRSRSITCAVCRKTRRTKHPTRNVCPRCQGSESEGVSAHDGGESRDADGVAALNPGAAADRRVSDGAIEAPSREFICRGCGRARRGKKSLGTHGDLCQACYAAEPSTPCGGCGGQTHRADPETKLYPRCAKKRSRPEGRCVECSRVGPLYEEAPALCRGCHDRKLHRLGKEVLKVKVECSVCGRMRSSVCVDENICLADYLKRANGHGVCVRCGLEKMIWVKRGGPWCRYCYRDHTAARSLKKFADAYGGPHRHHFADLIAAIDWQSVDERTNRRFRAFGKYLQSARLDEPLTWEAIEGAMPPLGPANRTNLKHVRSCLLDLGHLRAAEGLLERREEYVARRIVRRLIARSPSQVQGYLSGYAEWLLELKNTPSTIRYHLVSINPFWWWCEARGITSPSGVSAELFEEYEQFLSWKWVCAECQHTTPFDLYAETEPGPCGRCRAGDSLRKTRRYSHATVFKDSQALLSFFDWAEINGFGPNPVNFQAGRPDLTFRHYSPEMIKRLCEYIVSPAADPVEALVLYLIIFHAFSVWELTHALMPGSGDESDSPGLADAYHLLIPKREASRGNLSPGRPDPQVDFRPSTEHWLKPLLGRYERHRREVLENPNNRHLLVAPGRARHTGPVCREFVRRVVKRGSARAGVGECNPKRLRGTAGLCMPTRA